jgi:hypothetical protein
MARNETDRDDLMREMTSLVRRLECRYAVEAKLAVIGFNSQGWLFVYLGSDPMYRFDEQSRLRRAFVDGLLLRTEGHTLATMTRQREPASNPPRVGNSTTLVRRDLSPEQLAQFRLRMRKELASLCTGLRDGVVTRQYPPDAAGLVDEVEIGLQSVLQAREFLAPPIVRR